MADCFQRKALSVLIVGGGSGRAHLSAAHFACGPPAWMDLLEARSRPRDLPVRLDPLGGWLCWPHRAEPHRSRASVDPAGAV